MGKSIVFCADGTWNGPGQDEDGDDIPDPTNVFKLFSALAVEPGQPPIVYSPPTMAARETVT